LGTDVREEKVEMALYRFQRRIFYDSGECVWVMIGWRIRRDEFWACVQKEFLEGWDSFLAKYISARIKL
jgi:hypothetical protein